MKFFVIAALMANVTVLIGTEMPIVKVVEGEEQQGPIIMDALQEGWQFTNGMGAAFSAFQGIGVLNFKTSMTELVSGFGASLYGAEAVNHLLSVPTVKSKSVLLPLVMAATNGVFCFARLFLSTFDGQPYTGPRLWNIAQAGVEGANTFYFSALALHNMAKWLRGNSTELSDDKE